MKEAKWDIPPGEPLCGHLEALVHALKPLKVELNDGYADWFECADDAGVRLEERGGIGSFRRGGAVWHRDHRGEWKRMGTVSPGAVGL